jgi:ankyrin repeat protein
VQLLLAAGADVNLPDGDGKSALHWTASNPNQSCVDMLLGTDPSAVNGLDATQRTALHLAIAERNMDVMKALLAVPGCDCSLPDESGRTPLHWTVTIGAPELVEELLKHNPRPAEQDQNGATPLHYAAQHDQTSIIALLLAHDPSLAGAVDNDGRGAMVWAISQGNTAAVEALLHAGANPMLADHDGRTALHAAAFADSDKVVDLLVKDGKCEVDQPDTTTGQTALMTAAELGAVGALNALLLANAHPLAVDGEGKCALHAAAIGGHTNAMHLLLQYAEWLVIDVLLAVSTFWWCVLLCMFLHRGPYCFRPSLRGYALMNGGAGVASDWRWCLQCLDAIYSVNWYEQFTA